MNAIIKRKFYFVLRSLRQSNDMDGPFVWQHATKWIKSEIQYFILLFIISFIHLCDCAQSMHWCDPFHRRHSIVPRISVPSGDDLISIRMISTLYFRDIKVAFLLHSSEEKCLLLIKFICTFSVSFCSFVSHCDTVTSMIPYYRSNCRYIGIHTSNHLE